MSARKVEDIEHEISRIKETNHDWMTNNLVLNYQTSLTLQPLPENNTKHSLGKSSLNTLSPDKIKFTVNGSIHPSISNGYFMVPVESSNQGIYETIRQGKWLSIYGARASGKTTRIEQACLDLRKNGLIAMSLTLQGYNTNDDIWNYMTACLKHKYSFDNENSSFTTSTLQRFLEFIITAARTNKKKIVLFIDEFDEINSNQSIVDKVLTSLRGIKHDYVDFIQSIVFIGVYGVQIMNSCDSIEIPSLTLSGIREMFQNYICCRSDVTIDDDVIEDIFDKTNGHAGLVSFCGKIIDEKIMKLLPVKKYLTIEKWLQFYHTYISLWIDDFATMRRLIEEVNNDDTLKKLLLESIIGSERVSGRDKTKEISKLISLGVLKESEVDGNLTISSPLIKLIVLLKVNYTNLSYKIPLDDVLSTVESLNIKNIVLIASKFLTSKVINHASRCSYKEYKNKYVPHEYFYHAHLLITLKNSLDKNWILSMETKFTGENRRVDITVERDNFLQNQNERYVIEIMASDDKIAEQNHINKTVEYGKLMNASNLWVIHYVCEVVDEISILDHARSSSDQNVNVIVVSHSEPSIGTIQWKLFYGDPDPKVNWQVL